MSQQGSRKGVGFFIAVIILGALLGGVLGEILGLLVRDGFFHKILVQGITPTLRPVTIDLAVLHLTFGIGIKLTLLSFLGIVLGIWLYYKL